MNIKLYDTPTSSPFDENSLVVALNSPDAGNTKALL
jgi:hypothetical protein